MQVDPTGCALCDSTWGNHWEVVERERLFFCCALCAVQFRRLLERVRQATAWDRVDAVTIEGNRTGRQVTARRGPESRAFTVVFTPEGEILSFAPRSEPSSTLASVA